MSRCISNRLWALQAILALAGALAGCGQRQGPSISTPTEAQAALEQAFRGAKPEFKTAADEAAAAIQNEPGKALMALQALSSSPDLDSQQRNAAQDSIVMLAAKLRAAAAQGDAAAEKALQDYRASR
jgi:hypothetical protein